MLAEIIGIDRDVAIAFAVGTMIGMLITCYIYEKKIKEMEEEERKREFINLTSELG